MKVVHEECGYNLYNLITKDVRTYDDKSMEDLKSIVKMLAKGDKFYFEFSREDFFAEDEDLIKYRNQIPEYFKQNGQYIVKYNVSQRQVRSIGYLPINEDTYNEILILWKYFETVVFFIPSSTLSWEDFDKKFIRKKPEVSVIDFIRKKYTNSLFAKGYNGDNLAFIYGEDYDEAIVKDVISVLSLDLLE